VIDVSEAIAEAIRLTATPPRPEGSFTVREYMESLAEQGFPVPTYKAAADRLLGLVASGKMGRAQVKEGGPPKAVFWFVKKPAADEGA
jgi:hypothetical protein